MSLRNEIDQIWNDAQERIRQRAPQPGVAAPVNGPDMRFVIVNENFTATVEAFRLLADRIDALESSRS
ncbi:hypothetical protein [Microbacterium esteraromaticum]|uniref:hypothetical protein n=1 Tax=Microbacterium esteraromaticum TaxID=57043 RepID=UPI001959E659|nr:hypothetical protein [Microbacterium esteraromaticum]MBM7464629.1 hypothetical protein [Microbacterium esteraromaticum]